MIKYKGGERVTMLSGRRALKDYVRKQENARFIGGLLCEKENEIGAAVERLKEERAALKNKNAALEKELLEYRAREIDVSGEVVLVFDAELSGNGPRDLMNLLMERGGRICAVFTGTDQDGYRYVIGSRSEDVRPICRRLNDMFDGRGGGKAEMAQGRLRGEKARIKAALTR